jgi:hypothetical protein
LIPDLLSAEGWGGITKAAEDFTRAEEVEEFEFKYSRGFVATPDDREKHIWRNEDSQLDFTFAPYLGM